MINQQAKQLAACELIEDSTIRMIELQAIRTWFERKRSASARVAADVTLNKKRAQTRELIVLGGMISMLDTKWLAYRHNRSVFITTYKALVRKKR